MICCFDFCIAFVLQKESIRSVIFRQQKSLARVAARAELRAKPGHRPSASSSADLPLEFDTSDRAAFQATFKQVEELGKIHSSVLNEPFSYYASITSPSYLAQAPPCW